MSHDHWAENEQAQRAAWRRLSYAQRLQWLWEAKQFARRALEAAERRRRASPSTPAPDGPGDDKAPRTS